MLATPKTRHWLRAALLCVLLPACAAGPSADTVKTGKALFDERCKTTAGQKIYRVVEDVEGIVLLKLRPRHTDIDLGERDWPGAAFAKERTEEGFITSFLAYEHSSSINREPVTSNERGYITTDFQPNNPSNLPGYRYVDVVDEKTGARWRYSGRWAEPWQYDKSYLQGYIKFFLDRKPAPAESPRYGVTYEDHVIPAERALGLASSTVKVIDLKTQEVLGEFTRYAWTPGVLRTGPSTPASYTPWSSAYNCGDSYTSAASTKTRLFVDQVLKPSKEK